MLRRLTRHPAVLHLAARLFGLYLALCDRTTRWTLIGEAPEGLSAPMIAAFWHERLPLMGPAWRRARRRSPALAPHRARVLVSRHRDGRLIGAVVRGFGIETVEGSSSRGGAGGLLALRRVLEGGGVAVITPDGPRGPRRVAAPGAARLAALSGAPLHPCAAATTRRLVLRSWDRMVMPLPFARGVLVIGPALRVAPGGEEAGRPALESALTAACEAADAWAADARGGAGRS